MSALDPLALRDAAIAAIGEDRVPVDVLAAFVAEWGDADDDADDQARRFEVMPGRRWVHVAERLSHSGDDSMSGHDCECGPRPGILWPVAPEGDETFPYVERCDLCEAYTDDDAAHALVRQLRDAGRSPVLVLVMDDDGEHWHPAVFADAPTFTTPERS